MFYKITEKYFVNLDNVQYFEMIDSRTLGIKYKGDEELKTVSLNESVSTLFNKLEYKLNKVNE